MANNMFVNDPSNKGVDAFVSIDSSITSCLPWLDLPIYDPSLRPEFLQQIQTHYNMNF
jgi:hypothetical protein